MSAVKGMGKLEAGREGGRCAWFFVWVTIEGVCHAKAKEFREEGGKGWRERGRGHAYIADFVVCLADGECSFEKR